MAVTDEHSPQALTARPADVAGPGNAPADEDAERLRLNAFFHDVVQDWLADRGVTIACGRWADGAVSEITPSGRAVLMPGRYEGRFAGVREVRLRDSPHHLHIDLGRVHQVCYAIAPSVCLAFRPSLEVRLLVTDDDGRPSDRWVVAFMPTQPYRGDALDEQ